jgi:hypothetical protein
MLAIGGWIIDLNQIRGPFAQASVESSWTAIARPVADAAQDSKFHVRRFGNVAMTLTRRDAVSLSKREPPILFDPLSAEYLADPYPFLAAAAHPLSFVRQSIIGL